MLTTVKPAIVQSVPVGDEHVDHFTWHIRIMPRVATAAGFELGFGMAVDPSRPESTAVLLREAIAHGRGSQPGSDVNARL